MNTEIEHLADNKLRLTITIPEAEFETSIDKAFRKLATQVRLPGFRPGKAPRKLLEKHIGYEAGRAQAINDSLPQYYIDAIDQEDIDPVDYPELKLNEGEENGDVVFEATVAVRPVITVSGYEKLTVVVDVEPITDESIDKQIDMLRDRHADLAETDEPVAEEMYATIDISGSLDGEDVPGLSAQDYLYQVGSGLIGEQLDKELVGKKAGDVIDFTDELSEAFGENEGQEVAFHVEVKKVQSKQLPEVTDEWIAENTDFETIEAYKEDVRSRMGNIQKLQAQMQSRQKVLEALADIVTDDVPDAFLDREVSSRRESMAQQSGVSLAQLEEYLATLGEEAQAEFDENIRKDALAAIKSDLALRAIITQEKLEATDDELEAEIAKFAESSKEKINKIRNRVKKPGVEKQVRLDIARQKAVDLVTKSAVATDSEGNEIPLQPLGADGEDITNVGDVLASLAGGATEDHDHEGHDHDHDHEGHTH